MSAVSHTTRVLDAGFSKLEGPCAADVISSET
eukprot:SAG11_NODE_33599_length_276_cov_0.875706_1_plen_31_part_10